MENYREKRLERQSATRKNAAIVIGVILLLSIVGNIILLVQSSRMSDEKDELQAEKEVVISEKEKVEESNRQYREEIEAVNREKEELEEKLGEMEDEIRAKDSRIAQLSREAAEAEDLRNKLAEYENLEEDYEELLEEREKLAQDLEDVKNRHASLQTEHDQLLERKEEAKKLYAYNICVKNRQLRWICSDRYVERARRADQTFIDFEIDGSLFAESGPRTVHVVLYDPANNVMYPGDETFTLEDGTESEYTKTRTVEWDQEPAHVSFMVEHPERLDDGTYLVEVYIEGRFVAEGDFVLE